MSSSLQCPPSREPCGRGAELGVLGLDRLPGSVAYAPGQISSSLRSSWVALSEPLRYGLLPLLSLTSVPPSEVPRSVAARRGRAMRPSRLVIELVSASPGLRPPAGSCGTDVDRALTLTLPSSAISLVTTPSKLPCRSCAVTLATSPVVLRLKDASDDRFTSIVAFSPCQTKLPIARRGPPLSLRARSMLTVVTSCCRPDLSST